MKILNLSLGQDTGGQQMRLQDAWKKLHPQDEYISVTSTKTFYRIDNRMHMPKLEKEWWPWAELLHVNNDLRYIERFRRLQRGKRPMIIHHHGTMFRTRPDYHLKALKEYRATAIVSTVDLWAIAPEQTTWIPQAYELSELQAYRKPIQDGIFRIAHAPTNRAIKGTASLERAVRRLQTDGVNVELDIIERQNNVRCLTRKGTADVFVDQMLLGYGCNAVEAWGMGIPVIAGIDPEYGTKRIHQPIPLDTRDRMLEQWGQLPFLESSEDGLYVALTKMLSPTTRQYWSKRGMRHFIQHHEASAATSKLRAVYATAMGT